MAPRNPISQDADRFVAAATQALESLEMALKYVNAFSADNNEKDAEFARENAHAAVDAYCDNIRSAHKSMGEG